MNLEKIYLLKIIIVNSLFWLFFEQKLLKKYKMITSKAKNGEKNKILNYFLIHYFRFINFYD